jgi:hypothetical protein
MYDREMAGGAWAGGAEVEPCSMCGIRMRADQMVPDGGSACADIRWYCRDTPGCTQRWTARLNGQASYGEPSAQAPVRWRTSAT